MHIALMILSFCLLFILLLILLVLFLPLTYELDLSYRQSLLQFRFHLLNRCYGVLADRQGATTIIQLKLFGFIRPLSQAATKSKSGPPPEPSEVNKPSRSSGLFNAFIKDRALKQALMDLAKGIWNVIRPGKMLIKARIGFSEPHYTGWLMGVAGMLQAGNHNYNIQLEGVWDEPCLEGEIVISGRVMPARLLWQMLRFIIKPEFWSAYKRLRAQKSSPPQKAAA